MVNAIADRLLRGCPADMLDSHTAIADAIRAGDYRTALDLCDDWPSTYDWLTAELDELDEVRHG